MGKSGHVGRKIAATLQSTGTPGGVPAPHRSRPWRSGHVPGRRLRGHDFEERIYRGVAGSGRAAARIRRALHRHSGQPALAAGRGNGRGSGRLRPARSRSRRLHAHRQHHGGARARARAGGRADAGARLHRRALSPLPSVRPTGTQPAAAGARRHARGRRSRLGEGGRLAETRGHRNVAAAVGRRLRDRRRITACWD